MNEGDKAMGFCSCGARVECSVRKFSNGTLHLWATCPECGKNSAKRGSGIDSNALKFKINELEIRILEIPRKIPDIEFDEAVAMLERSAKYLMTARRSL